MIVLSASSVRASECATSLFQSSQKISLSQLLLARPEFSKALAQVRDEILKINQNQSRSLYIGEVKEDKITELVTDIRVEIRNMDSIGQPAGKLIGNMVFRYELAFGGFGNFEYLGFKSED